MVRFIGNNLKFVEITVVDLFTKERKISKKENEEKKKQAGIRGRKVQRPKHRYTVKLKMRDTMSNRKYTFNYFVNNPEKAPAMLQRHTYIVSGWINVFMGFVNVLVLDQVRIQRDEVVTMSTEEGELLFDVKGGAFDEPMTDEEYERIQKELEDERA
jgi:hypothetical protein